MIEKPKSKQEAREMLFRLSDRTHQVLTGIAILGPEESFSTSREVTEVELRRLHEAEVDYFLAYSNEALEHAGGYSLMGMSADFVARVQGCVSNAMGMPLPTITWVLRCKGLSLLGMTDEWVVKK